MLFSSIHRDGAKCKVGLMKYTPFSKTIFVIVNQSMDARRQLSCHNSKMNSYELWSKRSKSLTMK